MTTIQMTLPNQLAEEAAQAGLLASERIETLLRAQLRAACLARLRTLSEQLAADALPPMTGTEIQAEIDDFRFTRVRAVLETNTGRASWWRSGTAVWVRGNPPRRGFSL